MNLRIVHKKILTTDYYRIQYERENVAEWVNYDDHIFTHELDADRHLYDIINGEDIWEAL